MEHEKGLLEGIVILDLTRVLAGPTAVRCWRIWRYGYQGRAAWQG